MSMENPYSMSGETVLITGGGTGSGLGIGRCMLAAGAEKVILVGGVKLFWLKRHQNLVNGPVTFPKTLPRLRIFQTLLKE